MTTFRGTVLHLLMAVGILVSQLAAQTGGTYPADSRKDGSPHGSQQSDSQQPDPQKPDSQKEDSGAAPAATTVGWEFTQWPVLVVPYVASLADLNGTGIAFGAGFSEGYGSVQTGVQPSSTGSISVAQPYIGAFQAGRRDKLLAEYSPTIDLFNHNNYDGSVLQRVGIRGFVSISRQLRFVFSAYSTYGTEYLRELGGLALGDYPGYLTFALPTQTALAATGRTGLHWRRTPLQELSLTVGNSFSAIRRGPHYDATSARVQLTNFFGRTSNWFLFTQANRYSSQPGCTRVGPGVGLAWNASASTSIFMEAAPEFGSGRCSARVTSYFSGTVAQHLSPWTVLYLSATRDLVEPYRLQGAWTDIFTARLWRKMSQNTTLGAGGAYAHSYDLPTQSISRYHGFLLFSEFEWSMSESWSFVASYRYFKRDFVNPDFKDHHSWVFASIVWHPLTRGTGRRPVEGVPAAKF